jgi:hypothetical protein
MSLLTLFLILALICFILATIGVPVSRINLVALGLAFWVLGLLVSGGGLVLR